jgi:two-component system sensor histidine kinase EvgS
MILCVAFLITWALSTYLQKFISEPIMDLTQVASIVSDKKDFSVRAEKKAEDEVGVLIDVFNDMLSRIQSRDEELQEHREHLEEQVANRTVELREANQELLGAKDAAESANRAKSEFLANMSHEIRTPLNTVLGFTDLLNSMITDEKQKSYLSGISSSGKGLLTLINGILDLSKIEAGKMELETEPVNPHALFDEIETLFTLQTRERKIVFSVSIDPNIPDQLMLDEVRLKQILFNLIGNAVKFTEKGYVRIVVQKREIPAENTYIGLVISVEDSGIGIPEKYQNEIFEAFKQTDGQSTKRFGGTGLGLSITKRLVEMMDGTIDVYSRENRGSRFRITIPHVQIAKSTTGTDKVEPVEADQSAPLEEPVDVNHLPIVIDQLENHYTRVWEETKKNHFFNEIGDFAKEMVTLGEIYGVPPLITYGDELNAYVERFDVENMNATLDAYHELIEKIKKLLEPDG